MMKKILLTASAALLALGVSLPVKAGYGGGGGGGGGYGGGFLEDPFFTDEILPNLHKKKKAKEKQSLSSTYDGAKKSKTKK